MYLSAGNASNLVKEICPVMISDLREEAHAKFKLLRKEMTEQRSNTTKVVDHMLVYFDSLESTMPSAVVAEKVPQLRNDANVILEERDVRPVKPDGSLVLQSCRATGTARTEEQNQFRSRVSLQRTLSTGQRA